MVLGVARGLVCLSLSPCTGHCISICYVHCIVQSPANIKLKFSSHSSHQLWVAWIKVTREGPPPTLSNNGQIPAILLLLFWINVRCEIFERFGQFMTVVTWLYWRYIYRGLNTNQSSALLSNLTSRQLQSNSSQRYQETQLSQGDQF